MATEKKDKIARCEINESGRILNANRKFCKMFGFEADEPMWHYICDLYRYQKDWETYRSMIFEPSQEQVFLVRMKNRRGRSFKCSVVRSVRHDENGNILFVNEISRLKESAKEETDEQVGNFRYLKLMFPDSEESFSSAVAIG